MTLRTNHTWEKSLVQQIEQGLDLDRRRLRMLYELLGENLDCPSRLVFMTHRHDGFECMSLRDYVDTMSWLAYKQPLFDTLSKVRFLPEGDVPRL
jgi:hypothetical protein